MQRRHFIASIAATTVVPGMSFAQDNSRPLRIVVPFPPGGSTDMVVRNLQDVLGRILNQPVVIENRAGAGGSIGMSEVARATDRVVRIQDGLVFYDGPPTEAALYGHAEVAA